MPVILDPEGVRTQDGKVVLCDECQPCSPPPPPPLSCCLSIRGPLYNRMVVALSGIITIPPSPDPPCNYLIPLCCEPHNREYILEAAHYHCITSADDLTACSDGCTPFPVNPSGEPNACCWVMKTNPLTEEDCAGKLFGTTWNMGVCVYKVTADNEHDGFVEGDIVLHGFWENPGGLGRYTSWGEIKIGEDYVTMEDILGAIVPGGNPPPALDRPECGCYCTCGMLTVVSVYNE